MASPKPKPQLRKASSKAAKGTAPNGQNTVGKAVPKTQPAPKAAAAPPPRPDVADTHRYLDSVKPDEIQSEAARLSDMLKQAQQGGDPTRASAIKDAMAGLKDKGLAQGLGSKELGALNDGTLGTIIGALADAFTGGSLKRLGLGSKAAGTAAKPSTAASPTQPPKSAQSPSAAAGPAKGTGGGYSPGKGRNAIGRCGEHLAKQDLHKDGYTEIVEVQNKSGQGIDVVGRNSNGDVRMLEVKTTEGAVAPPLRGAQASMGGTGFTTDRLAKAAAGAGHYANSPDAIANAMKVQDWLIQAKRAGKKIEPLKHDVFIEDINNGCIKRKDSVSTPWTARAGKPRK